MCEGFACELTSHSACARPDGCDPAMFASAQKNWRIKERMGVQLRWDFQNPFHNYNWSNPTLTVNFRDPTSFGKLTADQRTASIGGQPLMNLTLQVTW